MADRKSIVLSKDHITRTAAEFRWTKKMPKWTVVVEGREFPARSLVLAAADLLPNALTNSHQAVTVLKELGFEIRYQGKAA